MFNLSKGFQDDFSVKQKQEYKACFCSSCCSKVVRDGSDLFANMYCITITCSDPWQM